MNRKTAAIAVVAVLIAGSPDLAVAQVAAESAIVTAGSTGQVQAQRGLASAIENSIRGAASTVSSGARPEAGNAAGSRRVTGAVQGNVDALAGTDAPSYKLQNGATIRVSGGFVPAPRARCTRDCPPGQGH